MRLWGNRLRYSWWEYKLVCDPKLPYLRSSLSASFSRCSHTFRVELISHRHPFQSAVPSGLAKPSLLVYNIPVFYTLSYGICLPSRRSMFDPWVRKSPWRRKWQPASVSLPGKIPRTEEPSKLLSMGLQRVGYNLVTKQQHGLDYSIIVKRTVCIGIFAVLAVWSWASSSAYLGFGSASLKWDNT